MSFYATYEAYLQNISDGKITEVALSHRGLDDEQCKALGARHLLDLMKDNSTVILVSDGVCIQLQHCDDAHCTTESAFKRRIL